MSCKNTRIIYSCLGIAKTSYSFLSVVLSLNNNGFIDKYISADVSVLLIAALCDGNLLCAKYKQHP